MLPLRFPLQKFTVYGWRLELDSVAIGGGFPIKISLRFGFYYEYISDQIIQSIKWICN